MNFLAHLYLSGRDPEIMIGNFIGDFVKGKQALQSFNPKIVQGIMLHRSIDQYTDTHAIVSRSKDRLRPKYHHYAGVIVDIFYDHFLASSWPLYHEKDLNVFADHTYRTLESARSVLPESVRQLLPYMVKGNWLVSYSSVAGIERALTGMSRRTRYESKMDEAVEELELYYREFQQDFIEFFPQLITMTNAILRNELK